MTREEVRPEVAWYVFPALRLARCVGRVRCLTAASIWLAHLVLARGVSYVDGNRAAELMPAEVKQLARVSSRRAARRARRDLYRRLGR